MTEILKARSIGAPLERLDGPAKVAGRAPYAYEQPVDRPAYVHPVQATVARGRVTSFDAAPAEAVPGVLDVLTPFNAPRLASLDDAELAILQSGDVGFRGQIIGAVVAETPEIAREAASLVRVGYATEPHHVEIDPQSPDLYAPDAVNPTFPTDTSVGDVDAALAEAAVTVDQTYTTAMYHNNPMEPHTTVALWDGSELTLYDSTQGVHSMRSTIAPVLGIDKDRIRVVAPHVGGGFGSKGTAHAHVILAALAAQRAEGRPVKLALTRQQMFFLAGYRTPTIQHVRLAADDSGHLTAVSNDVVEQTSRIKEFAEQTAVPTRELYAAPNRSTSHRLAALDVPVPSWMRAPGECPGMFAPEVAIDEIALASGIDPIDFRERNEPDRDPESGLPYSSRNLVACLRRGADMFGWEPRTSAGAPRRQGGCLVGTGVAASAYPVNRIPGSVARIRYAGDGRFEVLIGAVDIGTGAWTALTQIAADALTVPTASIDLGIGDTRLPPASVAGGSSGITCWGSAIVAAARAFKERYGAEPAPGDDAEGDTGTNPYSDQYAMHAFGAQFAEVRADADTGEVRVSRLLGVFAAGRIINARTARSQFIGGMTMGLSMALHEQSVVDPHVGQVVNHDFAEYHIATNADVEQVEATWLDEYDPYVNPMGSKGIGEIGIVGTAAAVANATYDATGIRIRDLPITPDKLLI
ncbi:MAG: xanthine dehydrogenase family protein molybdopterin-binding subunit [Streptosporangiales bacterium]